MNLYYPVSALINGITSLVLCIYVLEKNIKKPVNRAFGLFTLTVAFWAFSYFLWQISDNSYDALFWARMLMFGSIFTSSTFFYFITVLLNINKIKKKEIIFAYFLSIIFTISNFTPLFIKSIEPRMQFKFWPVPGIFFHFYMLIFHSYVIYTLYLIIKYYKNLSNIKKSQIKYILIGSLISFTGGTSNHLLWYNIPIPPYGNILASAYVVTAAYAIVKYQLLDIKIVITRGTIFTIVYATIFSIPILAAYYGKTYFENILGENWWIVLFIGGGALGYLSQMAYNYIRVKAELRLTRDKQRFYEVLKNTSNDIQFIRHVKELENKIVQALTREIDHVQLFIYNEEKDLYEIAISQGIDERAALEFSRENAVIKYFNSIKEPFFMTT